MLSTIFKLLPAIVLFFATNSLFADLSDDIEDEEPLVPAEKKTQPKVKQAPSKKNNQNSKESKKVEPNKKSQAFSPSSAKVKKPKAKPIQDSSREPVRFTSIGARGNREKGIVELNQDVRVFQGDFSLTANKAKLYLNKVTDDVERVVAEGNVVVEKDDPSTGERVRATADKAEFIESEQKVILKGRATLNRGKDMMKGRVIVYEMRTGWISAKKVDGVVNPQSKD